MNTTRPSVLDGALRALLGPAIAIIAACSAQPTHEAEIDAPVAGGAGAAGDTSAGGGPGGADSQAGAGGRPGDGADDEAPMPSAGADAAPQPAGGQGGQGGQAGADDMAGGTGGTAPAYPIRDPGNTPIALGACEPLGQCATCTAKPSRPALGDSPGKVTAFDFPGPIHVPDEDRIIIVEAEDLAHSGNWTFVSAKQQTVDGSAFTGRGFVRWTGPGYCCEERDPEGHHQGSRCDWLVVKIFIPPGKEGFYRFEARGYNRLHDGDNDVWVGYIGALFKGASKAGHLPINAQRFTFGSWHIEPVVNLKPGLYAFYYMGRSVGFGIDRIAVYPVLKGAASHQAREDALNVKRPASRRYPAGWFDDFLRSQ